MNRLNNDSKLGLVRYLHERVFSQLRAGERRSGSKEAGVRHFFDSFSDAQHEGGVDEGHDDVRVVLLCRHNQSLHEYTQVTNDL